MKKNKILSMGANGKGTAENRITAIHDIVKDNEPDIIFFQNCDWTSIKWTGNDIPPEKYTLIRHHDNTCIVVNSLRISNNRDTDPQEEHPDEIKQEWYSISILKVDRYLDIMCMSWNGPHNGYSDEKKRYFFRDHLMKFITKIQNKKCLPMIIAGGFNVKRDYISDYVSHPFRIVNCEKSQRRVTDFIITTDSLEWSDKSWLDLNDTSVTIPLDVLNHEPIKASFIKGYDSLIIDLIKDLKLEIGALRKESKDMKTQMQELLTKVGKLEGTT